MTISNQQMQAVQHGLRRFTPTWEAIAPPVWPFELPDWATGLHVDFMDGYANAPEMKFRKPEGVKLPQMGVWRMSEHRRNDKISIAWTRTDASGDLLERHWHSGKLERIGLTEWQTEHDDGYGGRTFTLDYVEGLGKVHLRGPWHGGSPAGYNNMYYVDCDYHARKTYSARHPRPVWHKQTAFYGFFVSDSLTIRLLARYQPHLGIARVHRYSGHTHIEPYKLEQGCPKGFKE